MNQLEQSLSFEIKKKKNKKENCLTIENLISIKVQFLYSKAKTRISLEIDFTMSELITNYYCAVTSSTQKSPGTLQWRWAQNPAECISGIESTNLLILRTLHHYFTVLCGSPFSLDVIWIPGISRFPLRTNGAVLNQEPLELQFSVLTTT